MGPKFSDPLYFEDDGTLEVCGPANFGPDDVQLEVLKITIVDHRGRRRTATPSALVGSGEPMWETEIANARSKLAVGKARGVGKARMTEHDGTTRIVRWADHVHLIDPRTFLDDTETS